MRPTFCGGYTHRLIDSCSHGGYSTSSQCGNACQLHSDAWIKLVLLLATSKVLIDLSLLLQTTDTSPADLQPENTLTRIDMLLSLSEFFFCHRCWQAPSPVANVSDDSPNTSLDDIGYAVRLFERHCKYKTAVWNQTYMKKGFAWGIVCNALRICHNHVRMRSVILR